MVSVLRSSASEAQKVEALQTAGIQSAKELRLSCECGFWCLHDVTLLTLCGVGKCRPGVDRCPGAGVGRGDGGQSRTRFRRFSTSVGV